MQKKIPAIYFSIIFLKVSTLTARNLSIYERFQKNLQIVIYHTNAFLCQTIIPFEHIRDFRRIVRLCRIVKYNLNIN